MDELFSCRNCVQNPGQGLLIGAGKRGFCLQFNCTIPRPERTTCKYLHRKDLPRFLVDEGLREHAAEHANHPGMVDIYTGKDIPRVYYFERNDWLKGHFDPILNALARYHRPLPGEGPVDGEESGWKWRFMLSFAGSAEPQRAMIYGSLLRRYMHHCGNWTSSWRLVLGLIDEIDFDPIVDPRFLRIAASNEAGNLLKTQDEARWELMLCRLSGLQEFGFHSSIQELHWVTDSLNGSLSSLDFARLRVELGRKKKNWLNTVIQLAKKEKVFFVNPSSLP